MNRSWKCKDRQGADRDGYPDLFFTQVVSPDQRATTLSAVTARQRLVSAQPES